MKVVFDFVLFLKMVQVIRAIPPHRPLLLTVVQIGGLLFHPIVEEIVRVILELKGVFLDRISRHIGK